MTRSAIRHQRRPDARPSLGRMLVRGLTRRCANCGGRHVFRRWFLMRDCCPTCRFRFNREEGSFLGAYVINFAVTEITLGVFMVAAFALTMPDPPVGLLAAIASGLVAVVALGFYPFSKTVWTAIALQMEAPKPSEFCSPE